VTSAVSGQLERRFLEHRKEGQRWSFGVALFLHVFAVGTLLLVAGSRDRQQLPREYAPVMLVPAARLGVGQREEPRAQPTPAAGKPKPAAAALPSPSRASNSKPSLPQEAPARQPDVQKEAAQEPLLPQTSPASQPLGQPQGVSSGVAFGSASVQFDQLDFTYGYYVDQMLALISAHWVRPPVGSGVEAVVSFRIDRTGRVSDLRITRSSGINSFDLAALRAVQSASPLPPLPRAYREGSLGVHLVVR
jgi:protein TonB